MTKCRGRSNLTYNDLRKALACLVVVIAFLTFVGAWIYCIADYGFLVGVGIGRVPSMIAAVVTGLICRAFTESKC